ncbi:MAG: 2-dehydropantoate 2-reductase [Limnohabitans sp.]|nr:2-dehydropantoate 2-reductase [Limnohabitans sp.]
MKVCIVGAGAIGGWIGVHLGMQSHVALSVMARDQTLRNIQQSGLQLTQNKQTHRVDVIASDDTQKLGAQDLVVIAVKAPAMQMVAQHIAPLLGKNTQVLVAMNGVPWWFLKGLSGAPSNTRLSSIDPKGVIEQAIPISHVIGCVVHASCATPTRGHIHHYFGNGLIIGEPDGLNTPRIIQLHQLLSDAGFACTQSNNIQKDIWYKLWGNMTINPISAITGATVDKVLGDDLVRGFVSQIMLEAKAIGAKLGLAIDQQPEDRHAVTMKLGAFKTSMLQDVEAHRPVELDALVSSVRELGALTQIPTPYTDALLGLSRLHAQQRGLYPL